MSQNLHEHNFIPKTSPQRNIGQKDGLSGCEGLNQVLQKYILI